MFCSKSEKSANPSLYSAYVTPVYVDKNNNGLVGEDEPDRVARDRELLGYGVYGWYCFNSTHDCEYRHTPWDHFYTPSADPDT